MVTEEPDGVPEPVDVDDLMKRGAEASQLRVPNWYLLATCVLAAAFGLVYDIPMSRSVGWFVHQAAALTLAAIWFVVSRIARGRARPRAAIYGKSLSIFFFSWVILLYVLATAIGLVLRWAGAPFPFTIGGVTFGLLFCLGVRLSASRVSAAYLKRVTDGRW